MRASLLLIVAVSLPLPVFASDGPACGFLRWKVDLADWSATGPTTARDPLPLPAQAPRPVTDVSEQLPPGAQRLWTGKIADVVVVDLRYPDGRRELRGVGAQTLDTRWVHALDRLASRPVELGDAIFVASRKEQKTVLERLDAQGHTKRLPLPEGDKHARELGGEAVNVAADGTLEVESALCFYG